MKKNKNLYFIVCDSMCLTSDYINCHFSSNCPYIFTSSSLAHSRLSCLKKQFPRSLLNARVIKVVVVDA